MEKATASELISRFSHLKIAIIGDIMLDRYIYGSVDRISPEAPIPIVMEHESKLVPGGAGNTAANVTALGAQGCLFGTIGADGVAQDIRTVLSQHGIDTQGIIVDSERPTTQKTRIIGNHQQIVRLDTEGVDAINAEVESRIIASFKSVLNDIQAVIICDYAKGVITPTLMSELKSLTDSRRIPLLVDPRPQHKDRYHGVTYLTPNKKETSGMVHSPVTNRHDAEILGLQLAQELGSNLLLTMSEEGMLLIDAHTQEVTHIPTKAKEVADVSGAGDTVITAMALGLAAGAAPKDAALIAAHAASVVVSKLGTATVSQSELIETF